jgi:pimeloyl-ACP methyl ester carboxylesterase
MTAREFDALRKKASTEAGEIAYVDVGDGPAVLFVHGVFMNGFLWRKAIADLSSERRCIAVDLPAHGASLTAPGQDLSLTASADLLDVLLRGLGIDAVDLVGNDTGGAVCQIFAVRHTDRTRTLTLTNSDAHDNLPPEAFKAGKELAEQGGLAPVIAGLGADPASARGEGGMTLGYENPERLSDDDVRAYLGVFADVGRAREVERFVTETNVDDLLAVEPGLKELTVPTLIVWGTEDVFFEVDWAYWLRDTIPGAEEVVEIPGGKLFFPDERAEEFLPHLRRFLGEHSPVEAAAGNR